MARKNDGEQLTFARKLPQEGKNLFVAGMAEFVGTFLFLFFALGGTTAVNTAGPQGTVLAADPSQLLYICICFGFSLAVTVWMFYRVSGGLFNPVVTLSLVLVGAVGPVRGVVVFIAQLLAGICAAAVLSALLPGPLMASTTLRDDTSIARGLFIEMFATSLLVLSILLMAVEKHRATFTAPLCIGLALFVAELTSIPYTGGSVNPARSFGPCVATRSFTHYQWIYWVGPILGSLLATVFYKIIKFLEYETCNPGQDGCGFDDRPCSMQYGNGDGSNLRQHNAHGSMGGMGGAIAGDNTGLASNHQHSGSDMSAQRNKLDGKLSGDTHFGPDGTYRSSTATVPNANVRGTNANFGNVGGVDATGYRNATNLEAGVDAAVDGYNNVRV
ncbi:aquaporin rerated protein, other eukaryote [Sporothrix brasiliensis 5110]|uniref:Aquaporin rerated protein, other eukaryote n=1 Tax=Sporothrix brasiliensis 5110 TaxID=1398154 RepID=A0A0C2J455_9PEZI|nr:aquaporin rerated protein, other eukaryote [Sporothrix brasiliensis 5110]KIH93800.1 aquaporin rerated protein, other eukaryote [Sporothrix brasiliensis 5110]